MFSTLSYSLRLECDSPPSLPLSFESSSGDCVGSQPGTPFGLLRSRMRAAKIKDDPAVRESWKGADYKHDVRLERRLRRRRIANEMSKENIDKFTSIRRTTAKNCGNTGEKTKENSVYVVKEEVDWEHKFFLNNEVGGERKLESRMGAAKIKNNPEVRESWKGADYKHDLRLERRLKRRRIANEMSNYNNFTSVRRTTVKNCGNTAEKTKENDVHVVEEDLDRDYKFFLNNEVGDRRKLESRTGAARIKINPGVRESWKGADYDKHDLRFERQLKRTRIANEMLNHDSFASVRRTTVQNCSNTAEKTKENNVHVVEEEVDWEYKFFLDNEVGGSDIFDYTSHNSGNSDDRDPQYMMFLENLKEDGNCYKLEVLVDDQLQCVRYEEEEDYDEKLCDGLNSDTPNMLEHTTWRDKTRNLDTTGSVMRRKETRSPTESRKSPEASRYMLARERSSTVKQICTCNKGTCSNVSLDAQHKCDNEVQCDRVDEDDQLFKNSVSVVGDSFVYMPNSITRKSFEGSDSMKEEIESPVESRRRDLLDEEVKSLIVWQDLQDSDTVDEDYQLFLNSALIDGESLVYMPKGNKAMVYKHEEEDGGSSDMELIVVEHDECYLNTPSIFTESYDISCTTDEENRRHSRQLSAFEHSQYRKGLMKFLDCPYDQKEYDCFLYEVSCRRRKERHRDTRTGMIKSCPVVGYNKSYLELYSDLAEAIDQAKEPVRVLFILRGFIYWLKNLTQEGSFRPWLDSSCLEILQKM